MLIYLNIVSGEGELQLPPRGAPHPRLRVPAALLPPALPHHPPGTPRKPSMLLHSQPSPPPIFTEFYLIGTKACIRLICS